MLNFIVTATHVLASLMFAPRSTPLPPAHPWAYLYIFIQILCKILNTFKHIKKRGVSIWYVINFYFVLTSLSQIFYPNGL